MAFLKLTSEYSGAAVWLNANEIACFKGVQLGKNSYTEIRLKNGMACDVSEGPEEVAKMLEGGD